ncbi:hypothetical protein FO440_08800 [Mucilaginibacter corticis]|uniref:Uncharacterized protein n=1 Tax=Mucilaginibacter corticis TaxID=2597670 RepID=A0A556MWG7_9SPHI|nr:hypothetical protein [Mucilaginibacter corticis]TSJ44257.1 hypothetical protein FO440_08800 [Mucilaginibacter corticis]
MGLPLRITFDDKDYTYQILNTNLINKDTTELEIIFNGEKVELVMDNKKTWVQKDQSNTIDPELIQALGRSVSLRLRM